MLEGRQTMQPCVSILNTDADTDIDMDTSISFQKRVDTAMTDDRRS